MQDHTDRRFYERIHLLAHARDKRCRLDCAQGSYQASLVDIGNGGARVRVGNSLELATGHELRFSLECPGAGALQGVVATVRWLAGEDLGIQFETPLGLPLRTLQDLVS